MSHPRPSDVPVLTGKLRSNDRNERLVALRDIEMLRADARSAIPQIAEMLKTEDHDERLAALRTISAVGANANDAMEIMTTVLRRRDETIGTVVRILLGAIDREDQVAKAAIFALGRMGGGAKDAVPVLRPFLSSGDPGCRLAAATALNEIQGRSDECKAVLVELLRTECAARAAAQLGPYGKEAADVVPVLDNMLDREHDGHAREAAAHALGMIGTPDAVIALTGALNDRRRYVQKAATKALELSKLQ